MICQLRRLFLGTLSPLTAASAAAATSISARLMSRVDAGAPIVRRGAPLLLFF